MDREIGSAEQCAAGESLERLQLEATVLLAELQRALNDYENGLETARELDEKLASWLVHMETRFGAEEACMRASGSAKRAAHVADHRRALADARQTFRHWLQHRDLARLCVYVQQRLPRWQAKHHQVMDRPVAAILRRREQAVVVRRASLPSARSS